MSKHPSPRTPQDKLNHSTPAAAEVGLGDILNDLTTQLNNAVAALNTAVSTKAGLVIHGAASTLVKSAAPIFAMIAGVPVRKAPSDMPALAGTLATAKSALWAFYINAAGALSVSTKTADAASHDAALALLPAVPAGKAMIGFIVVDNATGAGFVGGTTALDAASLTVTYYDTIGPVAPAAALAAITALASR